MPSDAWDTATIDPSARLADDVVLGTGVVIHAGVVLGPGVQVGDHVILSTFSNCGHCPDCEGGNPGNCSNAPLGGLSQPYAEGDQPLYNFAGIGAFVQETIVGENQCIPIPKEIQDILILGAVIFAAVFAAGAQASDDTEITDLLEAQELPGVAAEAPAAAEKEAAATPSA